MAQVHIPARDSPKVRLMVLETDEPHPDTQSERGSFGQILHHHFSKAGERHHPPLAIETNQVFVVTERGGRMPKREELDGYDGLLITGNLWVSRPDFHFTGVCFGHQLLSRLLGGIVGPAPSGDWELGHCRININPTGQRLFRTRQNHIHLHQMHQDQVSAMPNHETAGGLLPGNTDVSCWGHSEHTPIQGLYIPDRLFTTQAHLAFDEDMVKRQIQIRVEKGSIQDLGHADRAAETAHLEHDGGEVAKAILRLFVYDDDGMGFERE
ncbi:hypothetical protein QQS21_010010 [Conoideocrella luteorostrata]|uniref:Glutamine amidotransferase domain-containing protein n=1 Tax=Conoideocrella luteorostrata TaxID=1105319 RepID=A0AAJ0FXA3_9HYPO|nr:hypothetical protein QQS21_010010 [Conoideocrella luteorostrata]